MSRKHGRCEFVWGKSVADPGFLPLAYVVSGKVMFSVMYVCLFRGGLPCDHYPGCHWPVTRHREDPPPPDLFKLVYLGQTRGLALPLTTWTHGFPPPIGPAPHAFYMGTAPAPPSYTYIAIGKRVVDLCLKGLLVY